MCGKPQRTRSSQKKTTEIILQKYSTPKYSLAPKAPQCAYSVNSVFFVARCRRRLSSPEIAIRFFNKSCNNYTSDSGNPDIAILDVYFSKILVLFLEFMG